MTHKRDVANRIRPFLRAMERGIEAARSDRTEIASPAKPTPVSDDDRLILPSSMCTASSESQSQEFDPTRLKARPKRRLAS